MPRASGWFCVPQHACGRAFESAWTMAQETDANHAGRADPSYVGQKVPEPAPVCGADRAPGLACVGTRGCVRSRDRPPKVSQLGGGGGGPRWPPPPAGCCSKRPPAPSALQPLCRIAGGRPRLLSRDCVGRQTGSLAVGACSDRRHVYPAIRIKMTSAALPSPMGATHMGEKQVGRAQLVSA